MTVNFTIMVPKLMEQSADTLKAKLIIISNIEDRNTYAGLILQATSFKLLCHSQIS